MTRTGAVVIDRRLYENSYKYSHPSRSNSYAPSGTYSRLAIHPWARSIGSGSEHQMFDIVLVAGGLALFAFAIAYAYACDRL